ncbi:hypothetical protein MKX03_017748 [Papaver bracteatum]|nr:hypothetical protein MKX03_017748 [Papaver bracteatum]
MQEFTPEDKHCSATPWGPFAPPGTEVVAVQSLADNKAAFRVLATGEILNFSSAPYVSVKTRVGTHCKIINETALIRDMFTSDIETDQYKDATIKTVTGIVGKVNEAAWKDGQPREWIAKCIFDRKILLSDTVYMETLYDVRSIFNHDSPGTQKKKARKVEHLWCRLLGILTEIYQVTLNITRTFLMSST